MSNQMNELRLAVADILGMDQSWSDRYNIIGVGHVRDGFDITKK